MKIKKWTGFTRLTGLDQDEDQMGSASCLNLVDPVNPDYSRFTPIGVHPVPMTSAISS
jgi:hypothetical protein